MSESPMLIAAVKKAALQWNDELQRDLKQKGERQVLVDAHAKRGLGQHASGGAAAREVPRRRLAGARCRREKGNRQAGHVGIRATHGSCGGQSNSFRLCSTNSRTPRRSMSESPSPRSCSSTSDQTAWSR